jgi:NAD(P)-dependent dehydrogenase (short-subunit alcohol dehydrogenase family)
MTGRTVVVTGCTRGFGRVLVEQLASLGARLVVSGPWEEESADLAAALRERGSEAIAAPGDVTDRDQVAGLAAAAVQTFGSLDVWVNNAALATPVGRAFDLDASWFERSVAVNVLGTYHGARAAAEVMLPAGRGVIVNMLGRGDDVRATPHTSPYGASKAWARSFTRSLQKEYAGTGIQVVGFNPGMMLTDMLLTPQVVGDEGEAAMRPYAAITRIFGDPPEVAAAALVRALERPRPPSSLRLLGPAGIARHAARAAGRAVTRRTDSTPTPAPQRIEA